MASERSRVLSIDDYTDNPMQETPHSAVTAPAARHVLNASSESDDDENDHTTQPPPILTRRPRSAAPPQVKRSRSELSLESFPSDPEALAPKAPPCKRSNIQFNLSVSSPAPPPSSTNENKSHLSEIPSTTQPPSQTHLPPRSQPTCQLNQASVEKKLADFCKPNSTLAPSNLRKPHISATAHLTASISPGSNSASLRNSSSFHPVPAAAVDSTTNSAIDLQKQASTSVMDSRSTPLEARSSSDVFPTPSDPPPTNSPSVKAQPEILSTQRGESSFSREATPDDVEIVSVHVVKKPSTIPSGPCDVLSAAASNQHKTRAYSNPLLVNIAPLDMSDNVGWDRFVFFVHYPRRFEFNYSTHISVLSPFSGVTLNMNDAQPSNVCAVCGAGSDLHTCPRCTLGFHSSCVSRSRRHQSWTFCVACTSATVNANSSQWGVGVPPPSLPPPERALPRLIADVQQGNPIDLILIPSLFNFYVSNVGNDWLRCYKCKSIRIISGGAIAESVCIPFDCSQAFWDPEHLRNCDSAPTMMVEERYKVEEHLKKRSLTKTAMRYFMLGEEDRTGFGFGDVHDELESMDRSTKPSVQKRSSTASDAWRNGTNDSLIRTGSGGDVGTTNIATVRRRTPLAYVEGTGKSFPKSDSKRSNLSRLPTANGVDTNLATRFIPENRLSVVEGQRDMPNGANSHALGSPLGSNANALIGLSRNDGTDHRQGNEDNSEVKVRLLQNIGELNFDASIEDALMELALSNNEQLMNLYIAFGQSPAHMKRFKRQATLLVSRGKVHPGIIRSAAGPHMPSGIVANRALSNNLKNGTNGANSLSVVGVAQRRIQLGGSFKDFRLHQLQSELQLCSNVVDQLVETAPQNVAAMHIHTYSQIVALRAKQDDELRTYFERLASLQVIQHRQSGPVQRQGTLQRPRTQVHPQRQADTPQRAFRHLQRVATPQQEHIGWQNHFQSQM